MQQPDPLFNRKNVLKALVVTLLSMGALACTLYSPYVGIYARIALACVGMGITVFAAGTDLHLSNVPQPTVNIGKADTVTQTNNPAPTDPPPSPNPAAVNSQSPPPARNPHGQYAKRVPSVDAVSDS